MNRHLILIVVLIVCVGCEKPEPINENHKIISDKVDTLVDEEMRRHDLGLPPTFDSPMEIVDPCDPSEDARCFCHPNTDQESGYIDIQETSNHKPYFKNLRARRL